MQRSKSGEIEISSKQEEDSCYPARRRCRRGCTLGGSVTDDVSRDPPADLSVDGQRCQTLDPMVTKTIETRTCTIIDREEEFAERLSPHTHSTRAYIHCVSRRTETNYVIALINETCWIPWMTSQAIARVRSLPKRRDNRQPGLCATRRRGMQLALAWVPFIRGQHDAGLQWWMIARRPKAFSEGHHYSWELYVSQTYVREKDLLKKNIYNFHVCVSY